METQKAKKHVLPKSDLLYHGPVGQLVKSTLHSLGTKLADGTIVLRVVDTLKGLVVVEEGTVDYIFYGIFYFVLEHCYGYDHVMIQLSSPTSTLTAMFKTRIVANGFTFQPTLIDQANLWSLLLSFKNHNLMELGVRVHAMEFGLKNHTLP